jgi:small GTP-binding protein
MSKHIKICLIGDSGVGKSCLLWTYANNTFPEENINTVMDGFSCSVTKDEEVLEIDFWDTSGREEFDKIRPKSYKGTHIFLTCFSIDNKNTLDNISEKWLTEIKENETMNNIKVLVGLKKDLRDGKKSISEEEGVVLKQNSKFEEYFECSAKTNENVKKVFDGAINCYFNSLNQKKGCLIL